MEFVKLLLVMVIVPSVFSFTKVSQRLVLIYKPLNTKGKINFKWLIKKYSWTNVNVIAV